jgi:hypothetical protein
MQELLDIQKKYIITDKDLYVLSKLSADLKTSSLFEKQKVNAKIRSVLAKYNVGMLDKIKTIKALTKSDYHNSPELIEKYKDSEKTEELNIAGKKGKQNFIIIACVFVVIFLAVSSLNKTDKSTNSSANDNIESSNCNQSSHEQFVKEHFKSSGKDVYGISTVGSIGNCGYNFLVNGFDQSRGISFVCNVKTDGTNGIKIIDAGCDFN